MTPNPFEQPGRFYKGNLHTHSTHSDGKREPVDVIATYRDAGYDFIALTDHFVGLWGYPIVDTVPFRAQGFTTILGAELHSGAMANGELWHILAVGLPADFDFEAVKSLGLQLVPLLIDQLHGELQIVPGGGAHYRITFPAALPNRGTP